MVRLCTIAADHWDVIDTEYIQMNLIKLRFDRFLNVIFTWCMRQFTDEEKLKEWLYQLEEPLPGQIKKEPTASQLAIEAEGFMALNAALGGN